MRRLLLLFTAFLFIAGQAAAQRTVTGIVTGSADNLSLPGVSILQKGTSNGTVTDNNGRFSLRVPSGDVTLVISIIGYTKQEVVVNGATSNLDIVLQPESSELNEVIVVGYGTGKKVGTIVGSVQRVNSESIKEKPVANVLEALQGKVAGLQVYSSNGEPSQSISVRLHGVGSLQGSNTPLYVIDGVPIGSGDILSLNPNDIESATVLKDASASSIYGSRASNGVIYITTKSGALDGDTKISLKSQYGFSQLASKDFFNSMMNSSQLASFWVATGFKTQAQMDAIQATYPFDYKWYKTYYKDQSPTYQTDLSISGGTKKSTYYVSGSYFWQDGLAYNSEFKRYTLRSNLKTNAKKWLTYGLNVTGDYDVRQINPYGSNSTARGLALLAPPFYAPYDTKGVTYPDMIPGWASYNPKYRSAKNPSTGYNVMLNGSTYVQIMPAKGLVIKSLLGMDAYDYTSTTLRLPSYLASLNNGDTYEYYSRGVVKTITNTAEYKTTLFQDHQLTFLAGQEGIDSDTKAFSGESAGQTDDRLILLSAGPNSRITNSSRSQYAYLSYFGRIDYGFKEKYFADFSVRNDQSSRFGKNNRSAMFYAGGVMWNAKKESFLKNVDFLSTLNVKVSVGTSGNSEIANYLNLSTVTTTQYNAGTGWYISSPGNPLLGWEQQLQTTIGLKFSLFEDSYRFNIEGYNRKTSNMLVSVPYPYTTGFGSVTSNVGSMKNMGIDVTFDADIIKTRDLVVTPYVSFNYNKNEVTGLFNGLNYWIQPNTGVCWAIGKPIAFFYPIFAGIDPADGLPMWYKQGSNKTVTTKGETTKTFTSASTEQNTGLNRFPPFTGGFGLNASYRGFSLVADFAFALGKYLINNDRYFFENPSPLGFQGYNQSARVLDYWKKPGDKTLFPKFSSSILFTQFDSRLIENASFLRMKNLTVAYNLPASILKKTGFFDGARIFLTGRNLLTVTKYLGPDPEVDANLTTGVNPNTKQYAVGLDLNF